jgi:hypothetical protein
MRVKKNYWDNLKKCSVDAKFHSQEFDCHVPLDLWHKRWLIVFLSYLKIEMEKFEILVK